MSLSERTTPSSYTSVWNNIRDGPEERAHDIENVIPLWTKALVSWRTQLNLFYRIHDNH